MSAHEALGKSDEWYTPPYVFDALDTFFDMDVAHPGGDRASWVPALNIITARSLEVEWNPECVIWMNPPFGRRNGLLPWIDKFIDHGNGVALTPDRTSAGWWQKMAQHAELMLFVYDKIKFVRPDGTLGRQPGCGTTLFALGGRGVRALRTAEANGLGMCVHR